MPWSTADRVASCAMARWPATRFVPRDASGPTSCTPTFWFRQDSSPALASRAPLVVTAHGQDVRNVGAVPRRRLGQHAMSFAAPPRSLRSPTISAGSWKSRIPEAIGKIDVIDCGVDLDRFPLLPARSSLEDGPGAYLCVGRLTERKNVLRLARCVPPARRRERWHVRRRRAASPRAREAGDRGDARRVVSRTRESRT